MRQNMLSLAPEVCKDKMFMHAIHEQLKSEKPACYFTSQLLHTIFCCVFNTSQNCIMTLSTQAVACQWHVNEWSNGVIIEAQPAMCAGKLG